jgi:hypothetical protein
LSEKGFGGLSYLGLDVIERRWANDREADEEDIGLRVGERSKTIVILLSSGIPKSKANRLAIYHDTGRVIVEAVVVR